MKKKKEPAPVKPRWTFDLYFAPRQYPDHVTLMVHRTQKDMLTHRSDRKSSPREAFFKPTDIEETIKFGPNGSEERTVNNCYGELHFYPGSLTVGIIAHELYHVVCNWAWEHSCQPKGNEGSRWSNGILYLPSNEERCAELMGCLMAQTMVGLAHCLGKKFGKYLSLENETSYYQ
jgi:hypothetical protein